jgi:hypothetical protein
MLIGQWYVVRHPEMAMLTLTDMLVGTDIAGDSVPPESKICQLLNVATIEPISAPSAK